MKKISRDEFGALLNSAWIRSATLELGISAFKATRIYSLNEDVIPNHAYLLNCDYHSTNPFDKANEETFTSASNVVTTSSDMSQSGCSSQNEEPLLIIPTF